MKTKLTLGQARQRAIGALIGYSTMSGGDGLSACVAKCVESGAVADEYNDVVIETREGRGAAEQFRRLGRAYASNTPGRPAKIVADIEGDVERAALEAIERRMLSSEDPGAVERAKAERQLFNWRVAQRAFAEAGSVGAAPTPGPELADMIIEAARTDSLYAEAVHEAVGSGGPFLTAMRLRDKDAQLCRALRLHEAKLAEAAGAPAPKAKIVAGRAT